MQSEHARSKSFSKFNYCCYSSDRKRRPGYRLSVYIASSISPAAVNTLLAKETIEKLKEKSVLFSSIGGGIEVRLKNENITIDISDEALKDLIADYIHKDFRELFFGS